MLKVVNLRKVYHLNKKSGSDVVALNNVSIDFPTKGMVFLLGKSGSGKSTLLNCIGGLDTFDSGEIIIKGKSSKDFKQSDFDSYRNTYIGFIFQEYNILEEFSIGKNIAFALELQGKKADRDVVESLLEKVDLKGFYRRKPNQLSGGQKQRIAIARALIKDPEIIMADEPTGALDSNTGKQVMETLKKLSKEKLVIIVSHDREFAEIYGDRIIELKDGNIISDETKKEVEPHHATSAVKVIDDKIIHIKKGQQLTKDDLLVINRYIIQNKDSDTIISVDDGANKEIKRVASITDEGSREVFKQTLPADIKQENYEGKKFKLIRSRLKFKDSFKVGASSLKHKPIRLIFTILLSVVAFCMFGIVDTFASFNKARSFEKSLELAGGTDSVVIQRLKNDNDNDYYFPTDMDMQTYRNLVADYPDFEMRPLNSFNNLNFVKGSDTRYSASYTSSGLMLATDSTEAREYESKLLKGRLPEADDEIVVPEYRVRLAFDKVVPDDILTWNAEVNYNKRFKIVGVLKDENDLIDLDYSQNYLSFEYYSNYSLSNTMLVSNKTFERFTFLNSVDTGWAEFQNIGAIDGYYDEPENIYYSTGWANYNDYPLMGLSELSQTQKDKIILKDGKTLNNLAKYDIILSLNSLLSPTAADYYLANYPQQHKTREELENGAIEELKKQLNSGDGYLGSFSTYMKLGHEDEQQVIFQIVGFINDRSFDTANEPTFIISDALKTTIVETGYNYDGVYVPLNHSKKENVSFMKSLFDYDNFGGLDFKLRPQTVVTDSVEQFAEIVPMMKNVLLGVAIGFAVFAGLLLMNFIATSISYKKREIGVFRAIGARGKDVFMMFFWEALIIGIINWILSSIACGVVCELINSFSSGLGFKVAILVFGIRQIILIGLVSFLVSFVSSFFPVYKIARKNPIDSINNR